MEAVQRRSATIEYTIHQIAQMVGAPVTQVISAVGAIKNSNQEQLTQLERKRDQDKKEIASLQSSLSKIMQKVDSQNEMKKKVLSSLDQLEPLYDLKTLDLLKAQLFEQYYKANPNPVLFPKICRFLVETSITVEDALAAMKVMHEEVKTFIAVEEKETDIGIDFVFGKIE